MEKIIVVVLLHLLPAPHLLLNFKYPLQGERNPIETERMKKVICSDNLTLFIIPCSHVWVLTPFFFFNSFLFSLVPNLCCIHFLVRQRHVLTSLGRMLPMVEFYSVRMILETAHAHPK